MGFSKHGSVVLFNGEVRKVLTEKVTIEERSGGSDRVIP